MDLNDKIQNLHKEYGDFENNIYIERIKYYKHFDNLFNEFFENIFKNNQDIDSISWYISSIISSENDYLFYYPSCSKLIIINNLSGHEISKTIFDILKLFPDKYYEFIKDKFRTGFIEIHRKDYKWKT